jgi:hypothetical protein
VAGETESSRVGQTVSVAQEKIEWILELLQGGDDHRYFAEREKARHVGKAEGELGQSVYHRLEAGKGEYRYGGPGDPGSPGDTDIDPSNKAQASESVLSLDP